MAPENGRGQDLVRDAVPLNQYWNAVVRGELPATDGLDPDLAALVRRIQTTPTAPALSAAHQDRIWRELTDAADPDRRFGPNSPRQAFSPNGHDRGILAQSISAPGDHRRWLVAQFATAAILILTLVSVYAAFLRPNLTPADAVPPGITMRIDPNLPQIGVSDTTTLLATIIDAMPPGGGPYWGSVTRVSLAAGAEDVVGTAGQGGVGPVAFTVEAGTIAVEADGPVMITRQIARSDAFAEAMTAGSVISLDAGDQIAAPAGVTLSRRNAGSGPASILQFRIVRGEALDTPGALFVGELPDIAFLTPPTVPAVVALRRLTLEPGGTIPVATVPGLQLLFVDAGTIDLVDTTSGDAASNSGYALWAGSGTSHFGEDASQLVLANRDTVPAVLLMVIVTSPDRSASEPNSDSTADFPSGVASVGTLLRADVGAAPHGAVDIGLNRITLDPGAVEHGGEQSNSGVGSFVFVVEAGRVTVDADAPVWVTRTVASGGAERAVAAWTDVVLDEGDQVLVPMGVAFRRRNDGDAPTTFLEFAIAGQGEYPYQPGVRTIGNLPFKTVNMLPPLKPALVAVERLTFAPGATLPVRQLTGLELAAVERGSVDLVYSGSDDNPFGVTRTTAESGGISDFGPTPDRAVLTNRGPEPAELLVVTVNSPVPASAGDESGAASGVSHDVVLMQGTFPSIPEEAHIAEFDAVVIAPGVSYPQGTSESTGIGPALYRIDSGVVTIDPSGPIQISRAGASTPETILAGMTVVGTVGDQVVIPSGVASRWKNAGTTPLRLLRFSVTTMGSDDPPGVKSELSFFEEWFQPRDDPVVATVRRLTLEPGGSLAAADLPGVELLRVENGVLTAADWAETGALGPPFDFTQGSAAFHSFPDGRVFHNRRAVPVRILVVTISTVSEAGGVNETPSSPADLSITADTVLMQGVMAEIRSEPAGAILGYTTLAHGADRLNVESEVLAATDADTPEVRVDLRDGDVEAQISRPGRILQNRGSAPKSVLLVALMHMDAASSNAQAAELLSSPHPGGSPMG